MSSGMGLNGNVSRCFYYFQDFAQCMKKEDDVQKLCRPLRDDYLECLHHKKEVERKQVIDAQAHANKHNNDSGGGSHH